VGVCCSQIAAGNHKFFQWRELVIQGFGIRRDCGQSRGNGRGVVIATHGQNRADVEHQLLVLCQHVVEFCRRHMTAQQADSAVQFVGAA
jgi:hypothetical protein